MKKVLILDTSILCVWLDVPCMGECGPDHDKWNKARIEEKIHMETEAGTTFVLPLASIIESGNHIAHANHSRRERGKGLAELMRQSANQRSPWAAFSDQSKLWTPDKLVQLADAWPDLADQHISLGDATIKDVAEYYAQNYRVEILTGDQGLKAYQPATPPEVPRRRQR